MGERVMVRLSTRTVVTQGKQFLHMSDRVLMQDAARVQFGGQACVWKANVCDRHCNTTFLFVHNPFFATGRWPEYFGDSSSALCLVRCGGVVFMPLGTTEI